jgi:hypothetical protein
LAVIDLGDLPRKEARADGDYSVSRQDEAAAAVLDPP